MSDSTPIRSAREAPEPSFTDAHLRALIASHRPLVDYARERLEDTEGEERDGWDGQLSRAVLTISLAEEILRLRAQPAAADARDGGEDGVSLIAAERRRQIDAEGWTPEHDDQHEDGEMARAAACYALPDERRQYGLGGYFDPMPKLWPWDRQWWKPRNSDRVRELVKAGALIAAEIDRLQRLATRGAPGGR